MARRLRHKLAFSLLELLVVVSIVFVLAALGFSMIPTSLRHARKLNTESTQRKVDTALRLFKNDFRVYPWDCYLQEAIAGNVDFNKTYPDISSGKGWHNRLWWHLGTEASVGDLKLIRDDVVTARAAFDYDLRSAAFSVTSGLFEVISRYTVHTFRNNDRLPRLVSWSGSAWSVSYPGLDFVFSAYCNRVAQERFALAMIAGAVHVTGVQIQPYAAPNSVTYASPNNAARAGVAIVSSPKSVAKPGWAGDYLRNEISASSRRGEEILDAWGNPLVYVCQVLPGVKTSMSRPFDLGTVEDFDEFRYGLGPSARRLLAAYDPLTKTTTVDTPPSLPDRTNLKRSDIRIWGAKSHIYEFELWSAGHDGRFAWMRDEAVNRDNIAIRRYLEGIP